MNVINRYLGLTYSSAVNVGEISAEVHNALIMRRATARAVRFPSEQLQLEKCCGTDLLLELPGEQGEVCHLFLRCPLWAI